MYKRFFIDVKTSRLCNQLVRQRLEGDRLILGRNLNESSVAGLESLSLQVKLDALLLGPALELVIVVQTIKEILTTGRVRDVLNANVDLLRDDTSADTLVDDNSDGVLGHIVDATSLTVVKLVRHTLVERTVALDVDDVTALVHLKEGGQFLCSMVTELAREKVSSTTSVTVGVDHDSC